MNRFDNRPTSYGNRFVSRVLAAICVACGTLLWACNTTEGVGKDVKSLGKGIEETADDAKPK